VSSGLHTRDGALSRKLRDFSPETKRVRTVFHAQQVF
jgi:hypothetical protein